MNYRSILVHVDSDRRCAARVSLAIALARQHDCHLVGVAPTGTLYIPAVPEAAGPQAELEALAWDALRDKAETAAQAFREACATAHFKAFEVVVDERAMAASIVERAHCSDLVIVSQEDGNAPGLPLGSGVVEQVVMDSARPTLLIPYAGQFDEAGFAKPALVAWDDSREAARAVLDALPLLRKCERVQVVAWNEHRGSRPDASLRQRLEAMQRWLLWHGVAAEVSVEAAGMPVAEAMLSRAADLGSGLVVMGAYGHTRLSERILGGATRGLLQAMTVPVLMSH